MVRANIDDTAPGYVFGAGSRGEVSITRKADEAQATLQRLYAETGHLVFRRCLRMLGNADDAMDVTQATYLAAWEKRFVVRSRGEALAWLYQTATRRVLTLVRNRGSRAATRVRHGVELRGPPPPLPDQAHEARELIHRAVGTLGRRDAELALLTHLGGMSVERAAQVAGVSVRTVARARRRFEAAVVALQKEVSP